jgi:transposase
LGVELIAPVGGKDPEADKIRLAEFSFQDGDVKACPEGQKPWASHTTKGGKTVAGFDKKICDNCPKSGSCPVVVSGEKAQLTYDQKDLRLSQRRAREQTEEFKKQYAMRSGIEATNSRLARETKIKKLRYRRLPKIRLAVYFKVIGLNFKRVMAVLRPTNAT